MNGTVLANLKRKSALFIGSTAITLMLMASLTDCAISAAAGPVVALPNSYYLQPDKNLQTELVSRNGHRMLNGHVAAYAVSSQIVAGALGDVSPKRTYTNELPYKGGPETRYFILDTSTGKVESGLDADAWHNRLKALGVRPDFEIYPLLPWQS